MAINFNNQNQGIGSLNLGDFGLQQPEENITVAEAINYGVLPQAQEKFKPDFGGMLDPTSVLEKGYTGTTRGDFINAIESGAFGPGTKQMFDRNVEDVFEGVDLGKKGTFSFGDVSPTLIGTDDGSFRSTIDIDKGALSPDAIKNLPGGFFKSIGDQSSLGLPTNDKFAMAISNYDELFGPQTMTDAFGTTYNIPGVERPDMFTGLMNAKIVEPSRFQNFRNQVSGLKDFLPFGPKSLTGMAARGIGSMLSNIAPRTYGYSKRTYDAMTPSQQEFVDDLYDPGGLLEGYNKISAFGRGPLGTLSKRLGTIQNTLANQKVKSKALQQREQQISNAINEAINRGERQALSDRNRSVDYGVTGGPTRTDIDVADGGAESGGRGKIVCTMMNDRYGFGSFRNKIWMKFHENYGPEYQKGYHAIFLPLVKIAKGEGKINTAVRKVLEHMGRHVTADMFKIMKGKKRDPLGRIYRAIFEPTCRIIGKIKSALGRG